MRMQPVDIMGVVYSSGGLRFGGFPTSQFLELTKDLEKIDLEARDKIIAEAHYLILWLHKFPELAFLFGILSSHSLSTGFLYFIVTFALEMVLFRISGASPVASRLCWLWNWLKWPVFLGASIVLWQTNKLVSLILIVFLVVQGVFGIFSLALLTLVRFVTGALAYRGFWGKERRPWILHMEGLALQYVIDRWRLKALPPKEALKFYKVSKKDIEFYELSSEKSFMKAYKNRPLLNAVVASLWLLTIGGIVMVIRFLVIRSLVGIVLSFLVTATSLILWYILHNWALKHPKH